MDASLRAAGASLDAPCGLIDRDAFDRNISAISARADGTPVRVASKSLRTRAALSRILDHEAYVGVLAYTLPEAIMLARAGFDDIVVAYPTASRTALAELADDAKLRRRITLMVDSPDQLDLIPVSPAVRVPVRLCLDVDASYLLLPRTIIGPRRSSIRTPEQAAAFARTIAARPGCALVGVMAYEGQIAGVSDGDTGPAGAVVRAMQARSAAELAPRRAAIVTAVREVTDLEFVNGGGTGSIEGTASESVITEVAVGSGFFSPALFDHYRGFRHEPAAFFGLDVVRRPADDIATVLGGGWIASGPPGADRLPVVAHPAGLGFLSLEGAGEVQTPLRGRAAQGLAVGDRVWFRHAKAGEPAEHLNEFAVVAEGRIAERWPTYRGEGHAFL